MNAPKPTPADTFQFLAMTVNSASGSMSGKPMQLAVLDILVAQTGKPDRPLRLAMAAEQFQQFAYQVAAAADRMKQGLHSTTTPRPPGPTH